MFFKLLLFTILLIALAGFGFFAVTDVTIAQTSHVETIPLSQVQK